MTTAVLAAGGMVTPPDDVTQPVLHIVGIFLWFVAALLVAAAMYGGYEFAESFREAQSLTQAKGRMLVVATAAILTGSAAAVGGWLLI
ncbi:hypothetical protein [Antrihabitans spumae]|uniref:Integral membrane protein n=1 Tax=Antrihabitans spumae TaxID=3373370 RepID=A0ABW7KST2_9NOCA